MSVFYVPTVAAVYDESWRQTKEVSAIGDDRDIHLPEARLAELCTRQNNPMLPPTSRLRDRAAKGETFYFLQD